MVTRFSNRLKTRSNPSRTTLPARKLSEAQAAAVASQYGILGTVRVFPPTTRLIPI